MNTGICACGCGQQTSRVKWADNKRGLMKGEYQPFLFGHHRRVTSKYNVGYVEDPATGCWIWDGDVHKVTGYGTCRRISRFGNKCPTPHRYYYEELRAEVPVGLEIDHLCGNKRCVNPDHMEVVTKTVNMRRRKFCKLDMNKAREIRAKYAARYSKAALAREYGVSFMSITYIVRNQTWQEEKE